MGRISPSEKAEIVANRGLDPDDGVLWYTKFQRHKHGVDRRGLATELSFDDYLTKAIEAGLSKPEQIGKLDGQFVLGRHNDVGNYTVDSCRFITKEQNDQEALDNGRLATLKGKTKENDPGRAAQANKLAKEFVLTAPDGTVHKGKNVVEFCKQHGLQHDNLYKVFSGRKTHHKGWTGNYVD